MIILIDRSNIDQAWPIMYPGLSRAEYPEESGSMYSMEDIYNLIVNGEMLGYYQVESGYSGVVVIVEYPRKRLLSTFLGGKDPSNETPIDLEDLDTFLTKLGKIYEVDTIHVEGRRGWEKWTKPLGYSPMTVNLYKGVAP